MLRIGLCAPYDLAREGGVNSHIRAQAQSLRARGHHVCVFGAASAPLASDELAVSGCVSLVVHGTHTGLGVDPRTWSRMGRLFDREPFDLLHIHEPLMPIVPWCAALRARAPIIGTFHTYREQGHLFYPWARRLLTPVMARVQRRIAVSQAARHTVERYFPGSFEIVPNGIDLGRFATPTQRPAAFPSDRRHVLYVGRLEPRKGVEHLIEAVRIASTRRVSVRLVIAGDGPDRASLAARVRGARIDAHFAGRLSDDELTAYYQHADVVCAPAIGGESFGIVLLEAMAAGRPVVATTIDGYRELASSIARLVPPGDPTALATALTELLADDALRRDLGERGRAFAVTYNWTVIARQLEAIYYDVLNG